MYSHAKGIVCACSLLTGLFLLLYLCIQSQSADLPALNKGAGVTVLIHGWRDDAGEPAWTVGLQSAIFDSFLAGAGHAGKITVTGAKNSLTALCSPWDFNLASSTSCEIIVRVDWSAVANYTATQVTAQDIAAVIAPCFYQSRNGQPPLSQLPLHIIGHSRGAAVACELGRLLGLKGIEVDQITTLDPHPLTDSDIQPAFAQETGPDVAIDSPIAIAENVLFADNYWQEITAPMGQSVSGAYNRLWTSMPGGYHYSFDASSRSMAEHCNIHLMYHGTVDGTTPLTDGEAWLTDSERGAWYTAAESAGLRCGFYYSRLHGLGDRKSTEVPAPGGYRIVDGYHGDRLLGGAGGREPLIWTSAVWPNILTIALERGGEPLGRGLQSITAGEALLITYCYRAAAGVSSVKFHLDRDRNPYNSNTVATVARQYAPPTGPDIASATASWHVQVLNRTGLFYLCAEITDAAARTRYVYAAQEFSFSGAGSYEHCSATVLPAVSRGFLGENTLRLVVIIVPKGVVFSGDASPVWQTTAIQTLSSRVLFNRFILATVRIGPDVFDSPTQGFIVGNCTGEITIYSQ